MPQQAQITSVEAIESFKALLIIYLSQARPLLEEISREATNTKLWLQNDQRQFWQHELRIRSRKLEEAKQELFNAKLSMSNDASALQHMAVQRAQRAVHEAEAKLLLLKKWDKDLENRTVPLTKQIEQLHGFLSVDMGRAIAHLDQTLKILEAYNNIVRPTGVENSGV